MIRLLLFSPSLPVCEEPDFPAFASWQPIGDNPLAVGGGYLFTCRQGYMLNGSRAVRCRENGIWNFPPPTCSRGK